MNDYSPNYYRIWSDELDEGEQSSLTVQALNITIALEQWANSKFVNDKKYDSILVKVLDYKANKLTEWIIFKSVRVVYQFRPITDIG